LVIYQTWFGRLPNNLTADDLICSRNDNTFHAVVNKAKVHKYNSKVRSHPGIGTQMITLQI